MAASTGPPRIHAFHPPFTLARWNRRSDAARYSTERNRALATPPFEVDRFILYESRLSRHGAHYEEAATYPLA